MFNRDERNNLNYNRFHSSNYGAHSGRVRQNHSRRRFDVYSDDSDNEIFDARSRKNRKNYFKNRYRSSDAYSDEEL